MSVGASGTARHWVDQAGPASADTRQAERRREPRRPWHQRLTVSVDSLSGATLRFRAFSRNVTPGGMQFDCQHRIDPYKWIDIRKDGCDERVAAQVRYCVPAGTGYLIGVQFDVGSDPADVDEYEPRAPAVAIELADRAGQDSNLRHSD